MNEEIFESAKVYVFDFHMKSKSKTAIHDKKKELDSYFKNLRIVLEKNHRIGDVKCDVFLRKH